MTESHLLDQIALFMELLPEQRSWLAGYFTRFQSAVGNLIVKQNTPAEYFYVLLEGEVLIRFKPYDGEELTIAKVQPGDIFGWSAALGNPLYTASAVSSQNCQMLRMRGSDLHQLCKEDPETGDQLLEILANAVSKRRKNANNQVHALLEYGVCNSDESRRKI